jgi:phage terminase small subunit
MAAKSSFRHRKFAEEYVIDLNGTRAAQAAGIAQSGAHVWASRALKKAKVQRIIAELQAKRASKTELKAEKVIEEIQRLAFSNMQDYTRVDSDGKAVLDMSTITRDQFAAVQEIREDATGGTGDGERKVVLRTTLKLSDKTKNLELLGRHLGMFNDKLSAEITMTLASTIAGRRKRAASDDSQS